MLIALSVYCLIPLLLYTLIASINHCFIRSVPYMPNISFSHCAIHPLHHKLFAPYAHWPICPLSQLPTVILISSPYAQCPVWPLHNSHISLCANCFIHPAFSPMRSLYCIIRLLLHASISSYAPLFRMHHGPIATY